MDLSGRVLGGRYRVDRPIGQGGMGTVYDALQIDLKRPVAIKVLTGALDDRAIARFRQEATAAAALIHPNVVQVTDWACPDGEPPFLVMEKLEGVTLRTLLVREGRLGAERARSIALQMLAALEAAHRAGVVHRDIKPANVFLVKAGGRDLVKLLDFGIAKVLDDPTSPETTAGTMLGTPAYMAPERLLGAPPDPRSDLYAVGVCLFEMLAGRRPFRASGPELVKALLGDDPPRLASVADVPAGLAAVVDRALERTPERRYQSAAEVIEALEGCDAPPGDPKPSPTRDAPARRSASSRALTIALAACLATLAVGSVVGAVILVRVPLHRASSVTTSASANPSSASTAAVAPPTRVDSIVDAAVVEAGSTESAPPSATTQRAPKPAVGPLGGACLCLARDPRAHGFSSLCTTRPAHPTCRCELRGWGELCRVPMGVSNWCFADDAQFKGGEPDEPCEGYKGNELAHGTRVRCGYCAGQETRLYAPPAGRSCRGYSSKGELVEGLVECRR